MMSITGAWLIHPILIICLKIFFDIWPGMSQELSWTLTNFIYMIGSYIMFHWVRGIPFDFNAGAFDNLNMWEQIDNGDQYTPAKKYLLSVPIVLFLVSTHYTRYDNIYFLINLIATILVVIPKLPVVCLSLNPLTARLIANISLSRPTVYASGSSMTHQRIAEGLRRSSFSLRIVYLAFLWRRHY
jgi:hypothetical protein